MQRHPEHDDDPGPNGDDRRLWVAAAVVAVMVVLVLLHLTGVISPAAH